MFAKLFTMIILFWFINGSFGMHYIWDDQLNLASQESPFCKKCDTMEEQDNLMNSLVDEDSNRLFKRMHDQEHSGRNLGQHRKLVFHYQHPKGCSCTYEKKMIDLGGDYFPRYISDMVCFPGSCGPNFECRPKRFKLWVMRRRQEDEEQGAEPVPKELRHFWIGESIATTIDCECIA